MGVRNSEAQFLQIFVFKRKHGTSHVFSTRFFFHPWFDGFQKAWRELGAVPQSRPDLHGATTWVEDDMGGGGEFIIHLTGDNYH